MFPIDRLSRWYQGAEDRADASLASATKTATFTSPAFTCEDVFALLAKLTVTAVSGTAPTLDLRLETTADDGASWYTVAAFPQVTAVTSVPHPARVFAPVGQKCRWVAAIAGTTPSFTYKVDAQANRDD